MRRGFIRFLLPYLRHHLMLCPIKHQLIPLVGGGVPLLDKWMILNSPGNAALALSYTGKSETFAAMQAR